MPDANPPICFRCRGHGVVVEPAGDLAVAAFCPDCSSVCPSCDNDRSVLRTDSRGYEVLVPCECQTTLDRIARLNAVQIPARFSHCTLDSYKHLGGNQDQVLRRVRKQVTAFTPGLTGLVLEGNVGTGKTHLLVAILRALAFERGLKTRFVEFTLLLSQIKEGFDQGRSEAEVLGAIGKVPVLGIDELGKGLTTKWQLSILDELISRRYNQCLTTFFTTNLPSRDVPSSAEGPPDPAQRRRQLERVTLRERVGDRIFSRLHEMTMFLHVDGPDARGSRTG